MTKNRNHFFVYKSDKSDYTTVHVSERMLTEYLVLAGGDRAALNALARVASVRARPRAGKSWGFCVREKLGQMLKSAHADAERAAAELAAANNAAWESVNGKAN